MSHSFIKLPAVGNSMYPFFYSGDTIYVSPASIKRISIDDFVTFTKNAATITHRVIYKDQNNKFIITKGDTNKLSDGKIYSKNILGVVKQVKRGKKIYAVESLSLLQSQLYFQEIITLTKEFKKAKMPFVFLKGLPLHLFYEKTIPKRLFADCDMLINRKNLETADSILRKLGYKKVSLTLSDMHAKLKIKENELDYQKFINNFPITIDLHFEASLMIHQIGTLNALYSQKMLDDFSNQLLVQTRNIQINKELYPILEENILIVYLAIHLFHHNFQGYYRYEILSTILCCKKIDIQKISELIQEYKFTNFVYPVFFFLYKYYQNKNAKKILDSLQESKQKQQELHNIIATTDIFSSESRIQEGVKRFRFLFTLSPHNLLKKSTVFLSPPVLYSVLWVVGKKIQSIFIRSKILQFSYKKAI